MNSVSLSKSYRGPREMSSTITATKDDGYIVQRATKIVTAFNDHLAANCEQCQSMMREIYKNEK